MVGPSHSWHRSGGLINHTNSPAAQQSLLQPQPADQTDVFPSRLSMRCDESERAFAACIPQFPHQAFQSTLWLQTSSLVSHTVSLTHCREVAERWVTGEDADDWLYHHLRVPLLVAWQKRTVCVIRQQLPLRSCQSATCFARCMNLCLARGATHYAWSLDLLIVDLDRFLLILTS